MSASRFTAVSAATLAALSLASCGGGQGASRDQVRAVGSSTVYPFAKSVAESLARADASIKSPIIESTGTGAGMKLFCAGVGAAASRRRECIAPHEEASEFEDCKKNGVTEIIEIQVGIDGIAFAEAERRT